MHLVKKIANIKNVLKMVCLKTLISGTKSLENDSRKNASERVYKECFETDEYNKPEEDREPGPFYTYRVACWACSDNVSLRVSQCAA